MSSSEFPTRCQCKRHTPTNLRCSRCNVPICPHCSNIVATGQVCHTCLRGHTNHLYQFGVSEVARGATASLLVSTILGLILAGGERFGLLLAIWGGVIHGLAVAEACLRATGRKRGWQMEAVSGVSAGVGALIGFLIVASPTGLYSPYSYACIGISVFIAVTRIRSF